MTGLTERRRRKILRGMIRELYTLDASGCCTHVVTDDGNYDDVSVGLCALEAVRKRHALCGAIIEHYIETPPDRRWQLHPRRPR